MNKKFRKILTLLLVVIMVATSGMGCAPKDEPVKADEPKADSEPVVEAQNLTFVLHNEPDGIDPNVTSNTFASPFLSNCFEGLVTLNQNNEIVAGLAEKWDISPDGKTYTFTLREGLKWSDGSPLTSKDFLYSVKRVLTPETAAQYLTMVTDYIVNAQEYYDGAVDISKLGVSTPDEKTVIIQLKEAAPFFIDILSMNVYSPVQEKTITANGDKWTLNPETYTVNGPFKISEINMGESVVLVKNENYWDANAVKLDKITFRYIKDQATALTAFESDQIDGFREIPVADFSRLRADGTDLYTLPTYATTFYLINNQKSPYDNVKVRKAINLALDRKSLIENVLQSADIPASALISPGYFVDGVDYMDGRSNYGIKDDADVEEARKLLAEAGYPNGEGFPPMELSYYTNPQVKLIVEAMAQMFKENLDIEVNISTEEWAVYYSNVQAANYEIAAMGWGADYLHPMTFLPLFMTDDPTNNSFYSNKTYDAQVNTAKQEIDPKKAVELMRIAEDTLMADYPLIPLYHRSTNLMMKSYVKDWSLSATGKLSFKYAYIQD